MTREELRDDYRKRTGLHKEDFGQGYIDWLEDHLIRAEAKVRELEARVHGQLDEERMRERIFELERQLAGENYLAIEKIPTMLRQATAIRSFKES